MGWHHVPSSGRETSLARPFRAFLRRAVSSNLRVCPSCLDEAPRTFCLGASYSFPVATSITVTFATGAVIVATGYDSRGPFHLGECPSCGFDLRYSRVHELDNTTWQLSVRRFHDLVFLLAPNPELVASGEPVEYMGKRCAKCCECAERFPWVRQMSANFTVRRFVAIERAYIDYDGPT